MSGWCFLGAMKSSCRPFFGLPCVGVEVFPLTTERHHRRACCANKVGNQARRGALGQRWTSRTVAPTCDHCEPPFRRFGYTYII